ncbi:hypothetical protein [Saccharothrix xinjiangensis]
MTATGFQGLGLQARDVDMAGLPDNSAQAVAIGEDDTVYHRARNADGSRTPFYALNASNQQVPAKGEKAAIAATPDDTSQVLITGL